MFSRDCKACKGRGVCEVEVAWRALPEEARLRIVRDGGMGKYFWVRLVGLVTCEDCEGTGLRPRARRAEERSSQRMDEALLAESRRRTVGGYPAGPKTPSEVKPPPPSFPRSKNSW